MRQGRVAALLVMAMPLLTAASVEATRPPAARLYKLTAESSYQRGCFDPCMCPLMVEMPVRGTFKLIPRDENPLFSTYEMADVRWTVVLGQTPLHAQGQGTYTVGGEVAVQQQLSLDLSLDGGSVEHYDSGQVSGGGSFPIIDATISIHGMFCLDTVFHVSAEPVRVPRIDVDDTGIAWEAMEGATSYDIVRGELSGLREGAVSLECVANDFTSTTLELQEIPAPGRAWFILMRPVFGDDPGSYEDGWPSEMGFHDAQIAASPGACP